MRSCTRRYAWQGKENEGAARRVRVGAARIGWSYAICAEPWDDLESDV